MSHRCLEERNYKHLEDHSEQLFHSYTKAVEQSCLYAVYIYTVDDIYATCTFMVQVQYV
jgi:hypothetical protein